MGPKPTVDSFMQKLQEQHPFGGLKPTVHTRSARKAEVGGDQQPTMDILLEGNIHDVGAAACVFRAGGVKMPLPTGAGEEYGHKAGAPSFTLSLRSVKPPEDGPHKVAVYVDLVEGQRGGMGNSPGDLVRSVYHTAIYTCGQGAQSAAEFYTRHMDLHYSTLGRLLDCAVAKAPRGDEEDPNSQSSCVLQYSNARYARLLRSAQVWLFSVGGLTLRIRPVMPEGQTNVATHSRHSLFAVALAGEWLNNRLSLDTIVKAGKALMKCCHGPSGREHLANCVSLGYEMAKEPPAAEGSAAAATPPSKLRPLAVLTAGGCKDIRKVREADLAQAVVVCTGKGKAYYAYQLAMQNGQLDLSGMGVCGLGFRFGDASSCGMFLLGTYPLTLTPDLTFDKWVPSLNELPSHLLVPPGNGVLDAPLGFTATDNSCPRHHIFAPALIGALIGKGHTAADTQLNLEGLNNEEYRVREMCEAAYTVQLKPPFSLAKPSPPAPKRAGPMHGEWMERLKGAAAKRLVLPDSDDEVEEAHNDPCTEEIPGTTMGGPGPDGAGTG
ncbi:hypothetical protein GPECTOR_878g126 [Gonium pectorale]|uniref:Uncharacterized protein n=1 Tax=Gonium pectorale TaxID=33097 RepID=A0A150FTX8_GONPE|nr:hypothetical protein GPECTOR_878g126 [Gonium pectorale]|eukprot:KXZ41059.1 hypothetical protein GPECTOR_878g126 [Gonium pectorale]